MCLKYVFLVVTLASICHGQATKCDQTPPDAVDKEPRDNKHPYILDIGNAEKRDDKIIYTADQTYVLSLSSAWPNRTFRWFMITAEDPDVDNSVYNLYRPKDVGSLKTLNIQQSRHSERCANSVENFDNSDKSRVEVHWVSPHETGKVRIRAMVAENEEIWYEGVNLNMTLVKEERAAKDSSPYTPVRNCNICGEARYEVIFKGLWSRVAHPRHYPTKPDENGYTHMIGASHDFDYYLWKASSKASNGLKVLLDDASTTVLEREIINAMNVTSGTRTLIRGKRRHHPYMFEPSHSLFRVDRFHHLFSIVVGMRPSPDWFLGMTQFELCVKDEWLESSKVSLYPWDAGSKSGVSYESTSTVKWKTRPSTTFVLDIGFAYNYRSETVASQDNIERVEVGSFNKESPFYQMNLNDLKPFAELEVKRLDVYPWDESECADTDDDGQQEGTEDSAELPSDEPQPYPILSEYRQRLDSRPPKCDLAWGEWSGWSGCVPDVGGCGIGAQTRTRRPSRVYFDGDTDGGAGSPMENGRCQERTDVEDMVEIQHCVVEC